LINIDDEALVWDTVSLAVVDPDGSLTSFTPPAQPAAEGRHGRTIATCWHLHRVYQTTPASERRRPPDVVLFILLRMLGDGHLRRVAHGATLYPIDIKQEAGRLSQRLTTKGLRLSLDAHGLPLFVTRLAHDFSL